MEVNELIADRNDDTLEPVDFGVDMGTESEHRLFVLDVTPSQWDPNPEYPWPHRSPQFVPAAFEFDLWRRLIDTGRGRQLVQVIATAVEQYPVYASSLFLSTRSVIPRTGRGGKEGIRTWENPNWQHAQSSSGAPCSR